MDGVDVRLEFEGYGWAYFVLTIDGIEDRVDGVSYLGDALGEVVRAALAIVVGGRNEEIRFYLEPGRESYVLDYDMADAPPRPLRVRRFSLGDGFGMEPARSGRLSFEAKIDLADGFSAAVLAMADDILAKHGEAGYAELWDKHSIAFPRRAVEALRCALSTDEPAPVPYPDEDG